MYFRSFAPKDPGALAIQYTRYHDLSEPERVVVEQLGRRGMVVIKERLRNVAGADELSPAQVVKLVQARAPLRRRLKSAASRARWSTSGTVTLTMR